MASPMELELLRRLSLNPFVRQRIQQITLKAAMGLTTPDDITYAAGAISSASGVPVTPLGLMNVASTAYGKLNLDGDNISGGAADVYLALLMGARNQLI